MEAQIREVYEIATAINQKVVVKSEETKPTKNPTIKLEDIWEAFAALREGDNTGRIMILGTEKPSVAWFTELWTLIQGTSQAEVQARYRAWYEKRYHKQFSLEDIEVPLELLNSRKAASTEIINGNEKRYKRQFSLEDIKEVTIYRTDNHVGSAMTEKYIALTAHLTDEEEIILIERAKQKLQALSDKARTSQERTTITPSTRKSRLNKLIDIDIEKNTTRTIHPDTGEEIEMDYELFLEVERAHNNGTISFDFFLQKIEESNIKLKQSRTAKRDTPAKETNHKSPVDKPQKPKSGIDKLTDVDIIE